MNCEQNSQTGQKLAQAGNFFQQLQGIQFLLQGLLCTESHSHLLICDSLRTQSLYGTLTNSKETNKKFPAYQSRVLKVFIYTSFKNIQCPKYEESGQSGFHTLPQYISYCKVNQQENRVCFL